MCSPLSIWERCVAFHGHECPGLAMGFKAWEAAKEKMNLTFSTDEEVVCVTENDACGVDDVFTFSTPTFEPPIKARLFTSVKCESCGESAPEHKIRLKDGKKVCLDCFVDYSRTL